MAREFNLEVKRSLKRLRKSMKDLANTIDVKYNTLNWYLNGYMETPFDVKHDIVETIEKWKDYDKRKL